MKCLLDFCCTRCQKNMIILFVFVLENCLLPFLPGAQTWRYDERVHFSSVCVCVELKTKLSEINFRQVITFNQANNFLMFLIKMQLKSCVIIFGWWVENLTAINPINAIAFLLLLNQIHKILNLPRKWYWRNVPLIQHCQFNAAERISQKYTKRVKEWKKIHWKLCSFTIESSTDIKSRERKRKPPHTHTHTNSEIVVLRLSVWRTRGMAGQQAGGKSIIT